MTTGEAFGRIERIADGWRISGLPPHVSRRLKDVFPRIDRTATQPFTLRGGDQLAADLDWFMQRYPLTMADEDRGRIKDGCAAYRQARIEIASILGRDWKPSPAPRFRPGYQPYPYQSQAAEVARRMGRLLIADDVGMGKTISAIAAIADEKHLPCAVVVQSHLAKQWAREYVEEFTTLKAHIIKGRKPYVLPEADVYIFRYSNITGWTDYFETGAFKSVIFDEIQEMRHGEKTAKGRAGKILAANTELRIGLSATPIYNYGDEMFNVVDLLEPGVFGSYMDFVIEWCNRQGTHWVVTDPIALGSCLREANMMIRRDEHDAGWNMPPANVVPILVPHEEELAEQSMELAKKLAIKVVSGSWSERGQASREFDALMRLATGVAKARGVAAYTDMVVSAGKPMILAGWHRDVYEIWLRELKHHNPLLYTGTESPRLKDKHKQAFLRGESNLLILSLRSGAGLNGLQMRSHTVGIGELDWSPHVHTQIIGRLRRPGQEHQVDCMMFHAAFGADPEMIAACGIKSSQSHGIMEMSEEPIAQTVDVNRIKVLAERFLDGDHKLIPIAPIDVPRIQMDLL